MSLRDNYNSPTKEKTDFEPLPKGAYVCELIEASARQRPFTNAQGVNEFETEIEWTVVAGAEKNRRIWQKCLHRETMAWMMKATWNALGLDGSPFDLLPADSHDSQIWIEWTRQVHLQSGSRCSVDVAVWVSKNGEKTGNNVEGISSVAASSANAEQGQGYGDGNGYGGAGYAEQPKAGDTVPF